MNSLAYTRFELLRTFRNVRFFVFSLGFPLVLYYLIAAPNRNEHDLAGSGLSAPLYFMVGLAAFGAMAATLSSGARISSERAIGWNRQLRLTPLPVRSYFRAKIVTAYATALTTIVLLDVAGTTLGVRLPADRWLSMTWLMLVALIPFAGLGILAGHLLTPDTVGPAMGGATALFGFLGGTWYPDRSRRPARYRAAAPLLLARPGEPRRARRERLAGEGLDRGRRCGASRRRCSQAGRTGEIPRGSERIPPR